MSVSLEEALDRFRDQDPVERERFTVDDDRKATWAMRKLRTIKAAQKTNEAIAAEEISRVNEWLTDVNAPLKQDEAYFTGLLIEYLRSRRAEDGTKSITLPHGKINSRSGQPKWDVDSEEFLKWADATREELVRIKIEPNLAEAKKVLTVEGDKVIDPKTGEVVPGILIHPAEISYTVEVEA